MSIVHVAGIVLTVSMIALIGLVWMITLMAWTIEIRVGTADPDDEAALNRSKRRETSVPCARCAPHRRCFSVAWCVECAEWMCMQCWFACTVGRQPHSDVSQQGNDTAPDLVRVAGPQPDGTYVLLCDEMGYHAHEDGGYVLRRSG